MQPVTTGARGEQVRDVQTRLAALGYVIDPGELGAFGPSTERAVREFQQRRRVTIDGRVDEETWHELVEAGFVLGDRILYLRHPFYRGDDVRTLQNRLNLLGFDASKEDGIFGSRTERAVREFQRNVGLPEDGIVGPTSVRALDRLRPVGPGPGRAEVREAEALRRLSATIEGARIALDAAGGHEGPPSSAPTAAPSDLALDLAGAMAEELTARGAVPVLLRTATTAPSASERAAGANVAGAELLLSIQLGPEEPPGAGGRAPGGRASAYYYGSDRWHSQAGRRLAELVLEELGGHLAMEIVAAEPRASTLLRETRMPAVQVEPGSAERLRALMPAARQRFRSDLARAVADALDRFFGRTDPPIPATAPSRETPDPV